jgi:hypothetical protein
MHYIDVDSLVGLLQLTVAGVVADVSEVHVASIFRVNPGDESDMYLLNDGKLPHRHTV